MADQVYDGFISYSHAADDLLAPRLQSGLQRFAKPWWKRRALRVFRDESSLSANPHLWSSVTEALDQSAWFVLLLSPDAASSEWVNQEIEYWKTHKDASRILPVLTDGTFTWTDGDIAGNAAPEALQGVFSEQPRWVDMRFARDEEQLDLKNPRFSAAVADIASALRGVPKDELESEEVKQHRRTTRTAWAGATLVVLLAIAAVGFALTAQNQRDRAERNAEVAAVNEQTAESEAERANESALRAEAEAERARDAEALARSRELAASAINVLDSDPELSILLALEAIDQAPGNAEIPIEANKALRQALDTSRLRQTIPTGFDGPLYLDLAADGQRLATTGAEDAVIRMFDAVSLDLLWESEGEEPFDGSHSPSISPDGSMVAAPVRDLDGTGTRVLILNTQNGELVAEVPYPNCSSILLPTTAWYPDGSRLVVTNEQACPRPEISTDFFIDFIDTTNWQTVDLIEYDVIPVVHLSEARVMMVEEIGFASTNLGGPPTLYDMETLEEIVELDLRVATLSKDGSLLAGTQLGTPGFGVWDRTTLELVETLVGGGPSMLRGLTFSPDNRYLIQSTQGSHVAIWDLETGKETFRLNRGLGTATVGYDPERKLLYTAQVDGTIKTWDLSSSIVGAESPSSLFPNAWVNADGFDIGVGLGVATVIDVPDFNWYPAFFDLETGELLREGTDIKEGIKGAGWHGLPDGRFVIDTVDFPLGEQGPTVVFDPVDGSKIEILGCRWLFETIEDDGSHSCLDRDLSIPPADELGTVYGHLVLSIDRSELAVIGGYTNDGRDWTIKDTISLEIVEQGPQPDQGSFTITFSDDWILTFDETHIRAIDRGTGELVWTSAPGEFPAKVPENGAEFDRAFEVDRDHGMVAVVDEIGSVHVIDTSSWESWTIDRGFGNIRGMAFHPSRRQIALFVEGNMEVVDLETGTSLHTVPIENPTDGHWLDDEHIVVGTGTGLWTIITTSTEELVEIARERRPRSFTENECIVYGIDPCPAQDDGDG